MSLTEPTDLTALFIMKLVANLGGEPGKVAESDLENSIVALLRDHRDSGTQLRFSYSPYWSLREFLAALNSSGAFVFESHPTRGQLLRLTLASKRLLENGQVPSERELSARLGFEPNALTVMPSA